MGPEGAVNIVYKTELARTVAQAEAVMPQGVSLSEQQKQEILAEACKEKVDEFRERFANPYVAAERGYIDAVIRPSETRLRLNNALDMLSTKREKNPPKKHGNIPV
jgi:propionyl-CoA carboxylase beta chain